MRFTDKKITFIFLLFLIFLSCQKKIYSDTEFLLGTVVSIQLIDGGNQEIIQQSFEKIKNIEEMMSVSSDDYTSTVLLDINRQSHKALQQFFLTKKIKQGNIHIVDYTNPDTLRNYIVPIELAEVLKVSIDLARISNGTFDPTISPIVDLWGFNSGEALVPSDNDIQMQLARVNWQSMLLEDNILSLGIGQKIDVGAIAKGYAVDLIQTYLQKQGVKVALLDFGGSIFVLGEKQNKEPWKIGIQKPYSSGEYLLILRVFDRTGMSIVTSGVYERYFEVEEKKYFHILDPRTGYPARNTLLSVSIVHKNSIIADALATAVFVMGLEEGQSFIETQDGVEAIFITYNKTIVVSSGLKNSVELVNEDYMIIE